MGSAALQTLHVARESDNRAYCWIFSVEIPGSVLSSSKWWFVC